MTEEGGQATKENNEPSYFHLRKEQPVVVGVLTARLGVASEVADSFVEGASTITLLLEPSAPPCTDVIPAGLLWLHLAHITCQRTHSAHHTGESGTATLLLPTLTLTWLCTVDADCKEKEDG